MSQQATSTALMPHSTEPPVSQKARDAKSCRQSEPVSQGSSPTAMGRSRRSMMAGISAWSPKASPSPVRPASVSTMTKVKVRSLRPSRELRCGRSRRRVSCTARTSVMCMAEIPSPFLSARPGRRSIEVHELVQVQNRLAKLRQGRWLGFLRLEKTAGQSAVALIRMPAQGQEEGGVDLAVALAAGAGLDAAGKRLGPAQAEFVVEQIKGL